MGQRTVKHFPIFPLSTVTLPNELEPLHIFEQRYQTLVDHCTTDGSMFGMIWMSEEGLKEVGCCCQITDITERFDDGSLNIMIRGVEPFQLLERSDDLPYPSATVQLLNDTPEQVDSALLDLSQQLYNSLVETVTGNPIDHQQLVKMGSYRMAAGVQLGLDVKQNLLDLRSENSRLGLIIRLFRATLASLELIDIAKARAESNGKVRFG